MSQGKPKVYLVLILLLACLLAQPTAVESQCSVSTTVTMMFGGTTAVYKILTAPALCQTTMMNAFFCSPTAAMTTNFLLASNMGTVNPSCAWSCACGTGAPPHVTIDSSDGLPVELMDFAVE
ncbi:MAG: hypothetical protein MPN21_12210 [Thermoanaerobaculia bacterium]|nr:hypothetical protein [Thermoanaerobaculia bacterium]